MAPLNAWFAGMDRTDAAAIQDQIRMDGGAVPCRSTARTWRRAFELPAQNVRIGDLAAALAELFPALG